MNVKFIYACKVIVIGRYQKSCHMYWREIENMSITFINNVYRIIWRPLGKQISPPLPHEPYSRDQYYWQQHLKLIYPPISEVQKYVFHMDTIFLWLGFVGTHLKQEGTPTTGLWRTLKNSKDQYRAKRYKTIPKRVVVKDCLKECRSIFFFFRWEAKTLKDGCKNTFNTGM